MLMVMVIVIVMVMVMVMELSSDLNNGCKWPDGIRHIIRTMRKSHDTRRHNLRNGMVLKRCKNSVTVLLQCCYSVVTVLRKSHDTRRHNLGNGMVLEWCKNCVRMVSEWYQNDVRMVLEWCPLDPDTHRYTHTHAHTNIYMHTHTIKPEKKRSALSTYSVTTA
jgi:hypothetical protein